MFKFIASFCALVGSFTCLGQIDHWESVVLPGDNWSYLVPTSQPASSWTDAGFDDSSWLTGPSGIGYGDGDDATEIDPAISVYMRTTFTIQSVDDIERVLLDIDYDDGFIAYLNGAEIGRSLVSGDPPAYDQVTDGLHEAVLFNGGQPERHEVDRNLLQNGANILAVQVHNQADNSSDMTSIPVLSVGLTTDQVVYRPVPGWFEVPPSGFVNFESSNLPVVVIETAGGQEIPNEPKIGATMVILDNGEGARNYLDDVSNPSSWDFNGNIQIEYRGSSSSFLDKKQYALTTYDGFGEKMNVNLLGMPSENDWILNGLAYDPSLMRDYISYQLSLKIGQYASRGVYCELILNGDYRGVYILQEKLKADDDRIDINKIEPTDNFGDEVTGGYITKSDKTEGDDFAAWYMPNHGGWETAFIHEHPKPNTVTSQQSDYIQGVFESLATRAGNTSLSNGYPSIIDLPSFIDFMIINELASNVDGYQFSTFFHKDRNAKLRAGPVWDFNLTFGNDLFQWGFDRSHTDVWQFDDGGNMGATFWRDLYQNSTFECYMVKRWNELTQPGQPLHRDEIHSFIDEVALLLDEAKDREEMRWGTVGDYAAHLAEMKQWVTDRISWLNQEFGSTRSCNGESVPNLVITRINYHPMTEDGTGEKDLEFIEITNTGSAPVDATGVYFGGTGLVYQFPSGTVIPAGSSVMLANEMMAFGEFYGFEAFDQFNRSLSNSGQTIQLLNGFGNVIDQVTYADDAPWPEAADGDGYFLELIDPLQDNDDPANWRAAQFEKVLNTQRMVKSNISLYPNPATHDLTVQAESRILSISIFDIQGKVRLKMQPSSQELSIQTSELGPGVFLAEIQTVNGHYTRRFLVE